MSAGSGLNDVDLPPRLRRAIERERTRLGHAAAVLNCLMVAAMYDGTDPYKVGSQGQDLNLRHLHPEGFAVALVPARERARK